MLFPDAYKLGLLVLVVTILEVVILVIFRLVNVVVEPKLEFPVIFRLLVVIFVEIRFVVVSPVALRPVVVTPVAFIDDIVVPDSIVIQETFRPELDKEVTFKFVAVILLITELPVTSRPPVVNDPRTKLLIVYKLGTVRLVI